MPDERTQNPLPETLWYRPAFPDTAAVYGMAQAVSTVDPKSLASRQSALVGEYKLVRKYRTQITMETAVEDV